MVHWYTCLAGKELSVRMSGCTCCQAIHFVVCVQVQWTPRLERKLIDYLWNTGEERIGGEADVSIRASFFTHLLLIAYTDVTFADAGLPFSSADCRLKFASLAKGVHKSENMSFEEVLAALRKSTQPLDFYTEEDDDFWPLELKREKREEQAENETEGNGATGETATNINAEQSVKTPSAAIETVKPTKKRKRESVDAPTDRQHESKKLQKEKLKKVNKNKKAKDHKRDKKELKGQHEETKTMKAEQQKKHKKRKREKNEPKSAGRSK